LWLGELTQELKQKTYKADPLRRIWLDKPDGTQRPIGMPTMHVRKLVNTGHTDVVDADLSGYFDMILLYL